MHDSTTNGWCLIQNFLIAKVFDIIFLSFFPVDFPYINQDLPRQLFFGFFLNEF